MALASLSRVSVLNIKPPALRVELKGYTKKNTFRYDIDVQANIRNLNKERCLWALKHKAQHIQSGCVNTISSFRRNSDGK